MHLMQYGHKLMEETDYFQNLDKDDAAMSDQVTRQLDAMTTLRALIAYGELEGVKGVNYLVVFYNDHTYRTDGRPFAVGGFKVYGCEIFHGLFFG